MIEIYKIILLDIVNPSWLALKGESFKLILTEHRVIILSV